MIRESSIEDHLVKKVKEADGLCIKLNPTGNRGIPDRLVLLPGGRIAFAECKKPAGGIIARLQDIWRGILAKMGFRHYYLKTKDDVDNMLKDLLNG